MHTSEFHMQHGRLFSLPNGLGQWACDEGEQPGVSGASLTS